MKPAPPKISPNQQGSILIFQIIVIFVFSMVMLAVLQNAVSQLQLTRSTIAREQAFHLAEAGINYYEWHLAHYASDFKDGTGAAPTVHTPFPVACYEHTVYDKDTNDELGKYCLEITAPPTGSTIVTIKATGYAASNPKVMRSVTARYGVPSLAQYGFLTNSDAWIGSAESVAGQMHANGGIRFDGTGNAPITSAKTTYSCTSTFGCSPTATKPGIWGSAPLSTQNFWSFPVPNVDFSSMTSNLATIKSSAQASGIYLPPSNTQGYSIVFNAAGTVTVYKVTSLRSPGQTGYDVNGTAHNESIDYNARSLQFTQAIPANGLIYVEDKTWVEGTVNGRALVAAAKLPYNASTAPTIYIPNNILYTAKDGSSALGLIAQKDIVVTYFAPNTIEIDAALIAQNGSTQFFYYSGNVKTSINVYGTIGSYGIWTWTWVNGSGTVLSGYQNTATNYDANLLYGPPPSFPLSSNGYQQISWTSD
jgi:hypothetical protein